MISWRSFPYWVFAFLVFTVAITVWRYDSLQRRPYWGAAMGLFAQAEAIRDSSLSLPVEQSSPAPSMYQNSFVPYLVAGLQSILPEPKIAIREVLRPSAEGNTRSRQEAVLPFSVMTTLLHMLNFALAALTILLMIGCLRKSLPWGSSLIAAAAVLTTPVFLTQVELLGAEMFLSASVMLATALLLHDRPVLGAAAGLVAFLAKWTAIVWFPAALTCLILESVRRKARGESFAFPISGIVANLTAFVAAGCVLYFRSIPDLPFGGWVPDEQFGTGSVFNAWIWSPDLVVLAAVLVLFLVSRLQWEVSRSEGDGSKEDPAKVTPTSSFLLSQPFSICMPLLIFAIATLFFTGAVPASFVFLVPFLWMALAVLLLQNPRWNLMGMVVCFLVVGFNLLNSTGRFLPAWPEVALADSDRKLPSPDVRTGALLERSREYLDDYAATENAILTVIAEATVAATDSSKRVAIAAPAPFVQFLAMPGIGYPSPVPLEGYSLSPFTFPNFPSPERLNEVRKPRTRRDWASWMLGIHHGQEELHLIVLYVRNRFADPTRASLSWLVPPPPVRPHPLAPRDLLFRAPPAPKDPEAPPVTPTLVVYSPRRIPSATEKMARDDYLKLFRPVRVMLSTAEEYGREGELDTAERILREVLKTSPRNSLARYRLGGILEEKGEIPRATEEYALVPEGAAEHWKALFRIAQIAASEGQLETAAAKYAQCVKAARRQRDVRPHELAGILLHWALLDKAQRQWNSARRRLETAIELLEGADQESVDADSMLGLARPELGDVLLSVGEVDSAIVHLTAALQENPGDPQSLRLLGEAYLRQKNWSEAKKQFHHALAIDSNDIVALDGLATSLDALGDREGAMAVYRQALDLGAQGEQKANLLFGQAKIQKRAGRYADAIQALNQAIEAAPNFANAINELALTLATCPDEALCDGPRAIELASQLVKGQTDPHPAFLDTLALAHAQAGQFPQAVEIGRQAIAAAKKAGSSQLVAEIQMHLDLFKNQKPYRDQQP